MRASPASLVALTACLLVTACGGADRPQASADETPPPRTPQPAPHVTLTADDKAVWAPLPPDRAAIPVLLYHGIGPESDFSNADDASYGVDADDFAKQMTMVDHAGYSTVDLKTFIDFTRGEPVRLPPRPLLLTFDDARANSWTGADGILSQLGFTAVLFVDVGRVEDRDEEYLTWPELQTMQDSGRWDLQLHAGHGHRYIKHGPGADDYGPFYAYEEPDEDFNAWRERTRSDITWGERTIAEHIPAYRPLAFSPPFGAYGQDGTNDPRIPNDLLGWLTDRFDAVFTQDRNARATPGTQPPFGRIQVTRATAGGDLYDMLRTGKQ